MLNYFLWYAIVWVAVLILYALNLSDFNKMLAPELLWFLIITSLVALILGIVFRKKFTFRIDKKAKISEIPICLLLSAAVLEFLIVRNIPLISILTRAGTYGELEVMPILHVVIIAGGLYYSAKTCYCAICNKERRKKYIAYFCLINLLFVLYYFRACIVISIFIALNMWIAYLRVNKAIKVWHIASAIVVVLVGLYAYGGIGNMRHGYSWNDNSYIEGLGLYKSFPAIIPKQYMWTYSYLTTPLANLNINIAAENHDEDFAGLVGEAMPNAISKRIIPQNSNRSPILERSYFNATTGWCNAYTKFGSVGMYILYGIMILFGLYGVLNKTKEVGRIMIFCSVLSVVYFFMFFYNTLNYVAISMPLWASFYMLALHERCKRFIGIKG